jgi:hypothetical protein
MPKIAPTSPRPTAGLIIEPAAVAAVVVAPAAAVTVPDGVVDRTVVVFGLEVVTVVFLPTAAADEIVPTLTPGTVGFVVTTAGWEVTTAGCEVTTDGWEVMTDGCPVTTPIHGVKVSEHTYGEVVVSVLVTWGWPSVNSDTAGAAAATTTKAAAARIEERILAEFDIRRSKSKWLFVQRNSTVGWRNGLLMQKSDA